MIIVSEMIEAPNVGSFYLVPCVQHTYHGRLDWWPVIGPKHKDPHFFKVNKLHYHVDIRFLSKRQQNFLSEPGSFDFDVSLQRTLANSVLAWGTEPLARPQLLRRKCTRPSNAHPFANCQQIKALQKHYAGRQCASLKGGWRCPHKGVPLGSIAAIGDVVTCPAHGLRVDAATGRVLS